MSANKASLKAELQCFLDTIPYEEIATQVASKTHKSTREIAILLDTYANEAYVSLDLIEHHISSTIRILEVGSGLCLLSLFLKQQGYRIVALEPALGGYGIFEQTKDAILTHFSNVELDVLLDSAQQLNTQQHGSFDLIFSNNVIEHIPQWQSALTAMMGVLSAQGTLLHACPNYTIPYEPHYGVPVFRHFRRLSQEVFLSKSDDTDIWHSLNFITCRQIKKFCRQQQLACHFQTELLYQAFARIHHDPVFQERHQGIITVVANIMMKTPFKQIIRRLPACLSTPMIFEITHAEAKGN